MHRWHVGSVEAVRLESDDFAVPAPSPMPPWTIPHFAPSADEYRVAFNALAVRDGDTSIVIDPWLVVDRTGPDAVATADRAMADLAAVGHPPEQVDIVVHSHLDQIGWSTRPTAEGWVLGFPRARQLWPADEVIAVHLGADIAGRDDFLALVDMVQVVVVDEPSAITDRVTVEPAPGHNEGHQIVRIDTGDDLAVYFGHLILQPLQVADPGEDPNEADTATAAATRRRLLEELADRRGLALTTLVGGPGGGRVERDGDGYRLVPDHEL